MFFLSKKILMGLFFIFYTTLNIEGVEPKKTIVWLMIDYPPAYITSDGSIEGFHNRAVKLFSKKLPQFKHEFYSANMKRVLTMLPRMNQTHCSPGFAGPIIADMDLYFTNKMLMIAPSGIVINKKMKMKSPVSIAALLEEGKLRMGSTVGLTSGPELQEVIKKYKDKYMTINTTDPLRDYKLIQANRLDYVIQYPFVLQYLKLFKENLTLTKDLKFYPIIEDSNTSEVHAACSKTAAGKIVVNMMNKVIQSLEYKKKVINSYLNFLPKGIREKNRKINLIITKE